MAFMMMRNNGYWYAVFSDGVRRVWQTLDTKDEAEARRKFEELRPTLGV